MKNEQLIQLLREAVSSAIPPKQILTILIFGSFGYGKLDTQSDVDILIVHSSTTKQEYANVFNFILTFRLTSEKLLKRLVDIFFIHTHSIPFFTTVSQVHLREGLKNSIVIHGNDMEWDLFFNANNKEKNADRIRASALLSFVDATFSIPDINTAHRRNNLKKFLTFFKHVECMGTPVHTIARSLKKRMKNIYDEEPIATYKKDTKTIALMIEYSHKMKLLDTSSSTLVDAELSEFFLIKTKRFYSSLTRSKIDMNSVQEFFQKGLTFMIKNALTNNLKEALKMGKKGSVVYQTLFQELVSVYVNQKIRKRSNSLILSHFTSLIMLLDFIINNNLKNDTKNNTHK